MIWGLKVWVGWKELRSKVSFEINEGVRECYPLQSMKGECEKNECRNDRMSVMRKQCWSVQSYLYIQQKASPKHWGCRLALYSCQSGQVLLLNRNEGRRQKLDRDKRSGESWVLGLNSSGCLFQILGNGTGGKAAADLVESS